MDSGPGTANSEQGAMSATVLLQHDLPDGTSHVDWMLDLDPQGRAGLVTFRLGRRVDELAPGERLAAERIGDHRRLYLEHEGEVGGDRGRVRRLARGRIEAIQELGDTWALVVRWRETAPVQPLRLHRRAGVQWEITATTPPPGG